MTELNTIAINEDFLNHEPDFYRFGFVISKKYDAIIPYPDKFSENPERDFHEYNSRELLIDGYHESLKDCDEFMENVKAVIPKEICCIDSPELLYGVYLATIGEIVFLDSSNPYFKSGVLILPMDDSKLTKNQLIALSHYMKKIKTFNHCEAIKIPKYIPNQEFRHEIYEIADEFENKR